MSERRPRPRPRRRNDLHDKQQDLLYAWSDELCNSEEVPEVEIVSLLQEHIPKYRLRADSLTQFGGYENQDWFIPSPALPVSQEDLALTPDQIRETLNYFLLCSNRVSQMTKTYNDIEAVTRLLEEKEKDLELTARIGKELLAANGRLEARVTALESELRGARDLITQLRHDLSAKSDLLQILTNDTEEGSPTVEEQEAATAVALKRRTGALERENRALRDEAARLAAGADSAELAERQLLRDIASQLTSANSEATVLSSELSEERQRSADLQYQLDSTSARLAVSERSLQQLNVEHEHTIRILEITKENQNALASELADAKDRYCEVAALLAEAQEQLRAVRRRGEATRGLMPSVAAAAGLLPASLHREMHSSVYSEFSLDSGIGDPLAHSSMQKVFETVQCASRWSGASLSGSEDDAPPPVYKPPPKTSSDSFFEDTSDTESEDLYPGSTAVGVPGAPGAAELAAALRRLTPHEINSRRASLAASHVLHRRRTDRDASEESAVWGAGAAGGLARFRAPHKLQIVKPMEGSLTLHTWAQLAKPNMSGLLEDQEGVGVRGSRSAQTLGMRVYRLSDVEEDDDMPRLPHSSHIYTFTNSTVLHPNDGSLVGSSVSSVCSSGMSSLSSSVLGSAWSSRLTSRRSSAAVSPVHSRRESLCMPAARSHFTPTATPANSPLLGSPDCSPPPTPRPGDAPPSLHALIASGTSILRRRYLTSPNSDGSPAPLALQTPGSLYMGLVHRSPMEQLTCLKRTLRSPAAAPSERSDDADAPLGVPAHPGEGALDMAASLGLGCVSAGTANGTRRVRVRAPRPRTDLGTVGAAPSISAPVQASPLGTLSSFLFGRKGGLL